MQSQKETNELKIWNIKTVIYKANMFYLRIKTFLCAFISELLVSRKTECLRSKKQKFTSY